MAERGTHSGEKYTYRHIPELSKIKQERVGEILSEHGLGYGVDMTNKNPWKNRGPLKARKIENESDVQQKVEEGVLSQYYHEIRSKKSINASGYTTLSVVEYIEVGVSSNADHTLLAVGSQIHTRTIDFDISLSTETAFEKILKETLTSETLSVNSDENDVKRVCKNVIESYHCTHYIRALMLGAAEFEVLTAEEFKRIYGVTAGGFSPTVVVKRRKKRKYRQIGGWICTGRKYVVDDERVIAVQIAPIHTLVKTRELREPLRKAVEDKCTPVASQGTVESVTKPRTHHNLGRSYHKNYSNVLKISDHLSGYSTLEGQTRHKIS